MKTYLQALIEVRDSTKSALMERMYAEAEKHDIQDNGDAWFPDDWYTIEDVNRILLTMKSIAAYTEVTK